jgi:DNA-binding transcriptional MerR regulator
MEALRMRPDAGNSPGQSVGWSDPVAPALGDPRQSFTIAQLSQKFSISLRTLRFYEARGFVSPHRAGVARLYSQSDHDRIALVLRAKRLGFTLREIADLIADDTGLRLSRKQCAEQINHLERQKREIESALAELRQVYTSHYLRALNSDASGQG